MNRVALWMTPDKALVLRNVAVLLAMYDQGVWSRSDLFQRITLLVPEFAVQEIIDELPSLYQREFVSWLREKHMATMCLRRNSS
jgi:hypothetical protein